LEKLAGFRNTPEHSKLESAIHTHTHSDQFSNDTDLLILLSIDT